MKAVAVLCLLSVAMAVPKVAFPGADLITKSKPRVAFPNADLIKNGKMGIQHPSQQLTEQESRIVGGDDASIEEFPWQASLQGSYGHFCGASLISSQWLITAAHCVDGARPSQVKVVLGSTNQEAYETLHTVDAIHMHGSYGSGYGTYPNDIALLKLRSAVTTSKTIQPIGMASGSYSYAGHNCVITGWGRTSSSSPIPKTLQRVDMTVVSNNNCSSYWAPVGGQIASSHVCVFTPPKSACSGDSGGPLVCNNVLVGATSWGVSTCSGYYPSVYTRISSFRNWIQTTAGI